MLTCARWVTWKNETGTVVTHRMQCIYIYVLSRRERERRKGNNPRTVRGTAAVGVRPLTEIEEHFLVHTKRGPRGEKNVWLAHGRKGVNITSPVRVGRCLPNTEKSDGLLCRRCTRVSTYSAKHLNFLRAFRHGGHIRAHKRSNET